MNKGLKKAKKYGKKLNKEQELIKKLLKKQMENVTIQRKYMIDYLKKLNERKIL